MSLDRLRRNFHTGEFPIASNECLDDEIVAALAEGGATLDADTRARALRHVAGCALCRRAIASVAEAVADGPVTHEIDVLEGRRRRGGRVTRAGSFLRVTVPLAAAATIVVLLWSPASEKSATHRGTVPGLRDSLISDTEAHAPVPIAPRAAVARVDRFVWFGSSNAEHYRLRLYTEEGDVAWTTETRDTSVALPDSVHIAPHRTYFWKVEAQTEWQRWVASDLMEFRLGGPAR